MIEFWLKIPNKIKITSLEFNNFAICLIYSIMTFLKKEDKVSDKLLALLETYINKMRHESIEDLIPRNNNFTALTAVNLYLHGKLKKNQDEIKQGISLMKSKIIQYQMDDGFFPDTNMNKKHILEKNKGISHLTYHSKISMLVALLGIFLDDKEMQASAIKAYDNIVELSSVDGEACFYGRSQNALFGYACLFLGLNLLYKFIKADQKYLILSKKILKLILIYQLSNGLFSINFNRKMETRPGFDRYMFPIVYNTYANAMFTLSIIVNPEILNSNEIDIKKLDRVKYYKNSGFVKIERNDIEFCLNVKGHVNSFKHYMDSRVSPFSLLYLNFKGKDILPSVPMKYLLLSKQVRKLKRFEKLKNKFMNLGYNVSIGGFQPIFQKSSKLPSLMFYINILMDLNSWYLNKLKDINLSEKEIGLSYILKKSDLVHPWFMMGKRFLRKFILKKSDMLDSKKDKVEVFLNWENNSLKYKINGPPNMYCYFPLRFFKGTKIKKIKKRFILYDTFGIQIKIKVNANFKLIKAINNFYSGKCKVINYYLLFYQSENIIIEIEMRK